MTLKLIASGLDAPLGFAVPDDGTGRMFIVEKTGRIVIIKNGTVLSDPFLDLSQKIVTSGESGLLGLAFHQNFSQSKLFYVYYVRMQGTQLQSVIAEYSVSGDPDRADPGSERILFTINQPTDVHKGGQMAFGPDGFLYIAFGDGGGPGDPNNYAQDLTVRLGKILRIDVDHKDPGLEYGIPDDNPFAAGADGRRREIWASGFRNPWRFSFDIGTGRLFVGDVGENSFEEVDIVTRGGDYGWSIMEGNHCFKPTVDCDQTGLSPPIAEYSHSEGAAVIGGYVYRGSTFPALQGAYVFGDLRAGKIWALEQESSGNWDRVSLITMNLLISSFGQDSVGEVYVLDFGTGEVLKIVPVPKTPP